MGSRGRGKSPTESSVSRVYPNSGASDWVGQRKTDTKPIVYFSGTASSKDWSEDQFFEKTKVKHRCLSYAYLGFNSPLYTKTYVDLQAACYRHKAAVMLDSGAHSFHKFFRYGSNATKLKSSLGDGGVDGFVERYAQFVLHSNKNKLLYDWYVTFDYIKDCPTIYKVTKQLQKLGVFPVPVYHGDHDLSWVQRYIDEGHKVIGVGLDRKGKHDRDNVRRYYDAIFSLTEKAGVHCHGFAVTGDLMFQFPWYSCDSTTYIKAGAYGKILDFRPEKQLLGTMHVTDKYAGPGSFETLCPSIQKEIRVSAELKGFDFNQLRTSPFYRAMYNAVIMLEAIEYHMRRPVEWIPVRTAITK